MRTYRAVWRTKRSANPRSSTWRWRWTRARCRAPSSRRAGQTNVGCLIGSSRTDNEGGLLPASLFLAASLTCVLARSRFQSVREEFARPLLSTSSLSRKRSGVRIPSGLLIASCRANPQRICALRSPKVAYPPAMAPITRKGSFPEATSSGKAASGDSCDRSCWHAKNLMNARRS